MDSDQALSLRQLVLAGDVAALGTLHKGEPVVSMVPYAVMPGDARFVIHVSRLATHTRNMLDHPSVSLMVMAQRSPDIPAQALPRATFMATAQVCTPDDAAHAAARRAYLERFPTSEPLFDFADFSLVFIVPRSVRYVSGFAQAWSVTAPQYLSIMGSAQ